MRRTSLRSTSRVGPRSRWWNAPVRQASGEIVVIDDSGEVVKNTSQDQLVDVLTSEAEHATLDSPVPLFMEGSVGVVKDIRQEQTDEETLSVQQLEMMEQLSAAAAARRSFCGLVC